MSRRGENIRKRADGRWEGRIRRIDTSEIKYRSVYGRSYQEVKDKIDQIREQQESGEPVFPDSSKLLVRDLAREWLTEVQTSRKESTYVKYRTTYIHYIEPKLGQVLVHDINDAMIQENMPQGYSDSIVRSTYCVIKQMMRFGVTHYGLSRFQLENSAVEHRNKPVFSMNLAEQARLIEYLYWNLDTYKLGILVCLGTGLRLGEICSLKWSDIDWNLKLLHVNTTVQRLRVEGKNYKTQLVESAPKSFYSKREIPLSDQLYALLIKFKSSKTYLVNGDHPMDPRSYQYKFKQYLKKAGLADWNFHVLRHTFATNCIDNGADVKCVSELLGHADVKITLNRYVHPSMDTKRKQMNALSSAYGKLFA